MADNFGLKIGVEGEKEFKKALSEINQNFKVLGSEMKLVSSQFDKNDKSVDALTARNQVLSKEIDEQKNKIELLKQALDNASSSLPVNNRALPKNNPKSDDPISCSFALVYISTALLKSKFLSEAIPDVKSYETSFNVFTYVSPFIFLANDIGVFLGVV